MTRAVEYRLTIHDLPASERPRERLQQRGAEALSNGELLAIVLRVGTVDENALALASRLLVRFGGLPGLLRCGFPELCAEHGVGQAKASQVKAALELGRRMTSFVPEARATVRSPQDVANLLMADMSYLEQEELRVVLLDTKNQVMSIVEVYRGNVNSSVVRIGELFRDAVRANCPALVVVHNHPSGDPSPSNDDVEVTRQIAQAGKLLDIEVLDHLIIGQQRYVSLKERGLGFA